MPEAMRSHRGFLGALVGKESAGNIGDTGDTGLIPESGICPGEGNGNPLQYSCLENPVSRGAWWARVHRVKKESDMTEATEHACTHAKPVEEEDFSMDLERLFPWEGA